MINYWFTSLYFGGIYQRDKIPSTIVRRPFGIICNTDPSHRESRHWEAIFIDKEGHGYYFDSYGFQPLHEDFIHF